MTKLTKAQRARLNKLATYLEGLPKRYRKFSMATYAGNMLPKKQARYAEFNGGFCGTAACAVGHGPAAGVLMPPKLVAQFAEVRRGDDTGDIWHQYSKLFTGGDMQVFHWLFVAHWARYDNTPRGAAARIRYFLERGLPGGFAYADPRWLPLYAPYRIDAVREPSDA